LQRYGVFQTSITLNWTALPASPQSASSRGYLIEASTTNFGALSPGGVTFASATPNVALSTLTVAGLTPDATYFLRAGALNWSGAANFLNPGSTSTLSVPPAAAALATLYTTSTTVTWDAVTSQGYRVEASVNPTFTPVFFSSTASGGATALTVTGLSANTSYYYRVASLNWNSARSYADLGRLSTLALPPVSPFYPNTGVFYSSATVQWTAVASRGYQLDASTAPNFSGSVLFSSTTNGAATSLVVANLDSGTTYYFRVGSLNWNSAPNYVVLSATAT
ncbi:MAG: hypothetical protein COV48_08345, partial [Elusimicrobia bacterium CG11_big_fil_rev_8_21_14_0_20_64_6]